MDTAIEKCRQIPFYQEIFKRNNSKRKQESGLIDSMFLLTKEQINQSFPSKWMTHALKASIQENQVEWAATSGTTSDRLQIIRPKNWWKAEYRWLNQTLYPNRSMVKRAVLTTALCSADVCSMTQPSYKERCLDQALYLNIHHDPNVWQKKDLLRMVDEIQSWKPDYLLADPVYLLLLIKGFKKFEIIPRKWAFDKIIVGYEYLTTFNRTIIRSYFPARELRQLYGSTETGFHILEDDNHQLACHFRQSTLTFQRWKKNIYEVIVSSWKNPFMPLLNYRIGDLVRLDSHSPIVENPRKIMGFQGRIKEALEVGKHRYCLGEFEDLMQHINLPIAQYQIRSEEGVFTFIYTTLTDRALDVKDRELIKQQFHSHFDNKWLINILHQRTISPQSSGKFIILD